MTGPGPILDLGVPVVVWLLMLVVGLELTWADFARVLAFPRTVLLATAGQLVLLPLLAAVMIWTLSPPPMVVAGLVLVAASPGGALSNAYAYLAGVHVALSVTLTAVSSAAALVTMPLLCGAGFALVGGPDFLVRVPLAAIAGQLVLMLMLPVAAGMALRRLRPRLVLDQARRLRYVSAFAVVLLVALILADQRELLAATSGTMILLAVLYTGGAMAAGWGLGRVLGLSSADRFTLLLELSARNLAVTALVGVTVLDRPDFVLFPALFLLIQLPLIAFAIAVRKYRRGVFLSGSRGDICR